MGGEHRQPTKMRLRFLRRYRFHRNLQSPANGLSNVTHGYAFFGHGVIFCAGLVLLQDKPVKARDIRDVRRRPAIASFPDISRHAFLARQGDQISDKPLLNGVVNLGKAHDRSFDVLQRQSRLFRNAGKWEIRWYVHIFSRKLTRRANSAVPDVTIKGRLEPASTEPRASMARRSISQFS